MIQIGNITSSCKYYIVWCTKYRRKVLCEQGVDRCLKELILKYARAEIIKIEIMPDHVVLLVDHVDPRYGIHRLICEIKGKTSHMLRDQYCWLKTCLPTLWTRAYFVSSVGDTPVESIQNYIEEQKYV